MTTAEAEICRMLAPPCGARARALVNGDSDRSSSPVHGRTVYGSSIAANGGAFFSCSSSSPIAANGGAFFSCSSSSPIAANVALERRCPGPTPSAMQQRDSAGNSAEMSLKEMAPLLPRCVMSSSRMAFSKSVHSNLKSERKSMESRYPRAFSSSAELSMEPPPIDNDIRDVQKQFGAVFSDDQSNVPISFGNDGDAIRAAAMHAVVVDRSHYGRIRVSDVDRIRFLHNQSTADFQSLKPGQGCDTVFVTPTARTIDLATAYVMNNSVMVVVSPSVRHDLLKTLDKYIFFADKVKLDDITDKTAMLSIIGPKSSEILESMKAGTIVGMPYGSTIHFELNGEPVTIASGAGIASEGYTLITSADSVGYVWETLVNKGVVPMGDAAWEKLCILEGRPSPGKELTGDYNPLEAGLWKTISLNKGCYIGQETIARVITYDAVKQQLWGLELEGPAEPGTVITLANGDEKVGTLTSVAELEGRYFGLGYIKRKAGGEGLQVAVGKTNGLVVEVPYLTRALIT